MRLLTFLIELSSPFLLFLTTNDLHRPSLNAMRKKELLDNQQHSSCYDARETPVLIAVKVIPHSTVSTESQSQWKEYWSATRNTIKETQTVIHGNYTSECIKTGPPGPDIVTWWTTMSTTYCPSLTAPSVIGDISRYTVKVSTICRNSILLSNRVNSDWSDKMWISTEPQTRRRTLCWSRDNRTGTTIHCYFCSPSTYQMSTFIRAAYRFSHL